MVKTNPIKWLTLLVLFVCSKISPFTLSSGLPNDDVITEETGFKTFHYVFNNLFHKLMFISKRTEDTLP